MHFKHNYTLDSALGGATGPVTNLAVVKKLLLFLLLMGPALALTADELVTRNLEARGGQEALRAIQSLKSVGRYVGGGGFELAYTSLVKRLGKLRNEVTLQGLTAITASDGRQAWQLNPFGGRREAEKMSAEEARALSWESELEGPLLDYRSKGYQLELLGSEDVDGTAAHKLRVTRKDGQSELVYLDPDYFLEIRIVRTKKVRGVEQVEEIDLGNYEKIGGVYFPFAIESGSRGSSSKGKIVIEKMEVNLPLEDAQFSMPGGSQ